MNARLFNIDDSADISIQAKDFKHQKPAIPQDLIPSTFVIRHDFNDVDELGTFAHEWDLDLRQLNRGGFRGDLIHAGGPGLALSRTRLQGVLHQFGASPPGLCTFALSTNESIKLCWRGHQVETDQILVYPTGGEHESISQPDFDMVLVSITEDSLEAARRRLGIAGTGELFTRTEIASCGRLEIAQLRKWILQNLAGVSRSPELLEDPEYLRGATLEAGDLLMRAINAGRADSMQRRSARQRRLVDHALLLARSDAIRIHSVSELSRESGASPRTLRRGFQERFGVSPKAYLKAQRMVGVRRELRSRPQGTLVTDVANRWGFWHMGQFASDYRAMFGELPSETLRTR